ncbi:MAG: MCE family protein [Opitutaceae bacterium]|nr:MCE family protein [Verrucomicrobiales bacterium]
MSETRFEIKVGIFIAIALVILAALMVNFSKGVSFFTATYHLNLRTLNVGGIKADAGVLMSGVPIGNVSLAELAPDGKSVILRLRILRKFQIRNDAVFIIEQSGFLGDQYVAVYPKGQTNEFLPDGAVVDCEEPFNIQEVARSAAGFITRMDDTVKKLDQAITRVDRLVLNEETLTNLAITVRNLREASESAMQVVRKVDTVISTNSPSVGITLSNLSQFSERLNDLSDQLSATVATNGAKLAGAMSNLEHASQTADSLLTDVQAGKGLAGGLLRDESMKMDMKNMVANLTTLSSNLNKYGLLYKPRPTNLAPATNSFPYPGKR